MPGKAAPKPKKLLSKASLQLAWQNAKQQRKRFSSYGVDGKSGREFSANLDVNFADIARRLAAGEYRFNDLRCRWIAKKDNPNKQRLICIPTISDRLVQRAIAAILEKNDRLGVKNEVSFGFRNGLGVSDALKRAIELRNTGTAWAVKTDVVAFFDRIDRVKLLQRIQNSVPSSLHPLLKQIINCEAKIYDNEDAAKLKLNGIEFGRGLRQGMPLSPLLSNFEMRNFDKLAIKHGLKMVRYADDIVVFCRTKKEAKTIFADLVKWLAILGHSLPAIEDRKKTKIVPPGDPVEFLGLDISLSRETKNYIASLPEKIIEQIIGETRRISTLNTCSEKKWDFTDFIKGMRARNQSYRSTYKLANNLEGFLHRLQIATNDSTRKLLVELFGEEAMSRITDEKLKFLGVIPRDNK